MDIWIENTREDHNHGGVGWEYGTCLWSPTTNKTGGKIYEIMHLPKVNDLVLHFYKISNVTYYHGFSYVKNQCKIINVAPPEPGTWDWAVEFYRIDLKNFEHFPEPIRIDSFTKNYDLEIRNEILDAAPPNYPFEIARFKNPKFKKDSIVKLSQGKYLRQCSGKLFELLQEITKIEGGFKTKSETGKEPIKREYIEGKRKQRETYFFARNPQLVSDAKKTLGYVCQACGFDFESVYGELGKEYIECHHENVLSERSEKEWNENITTSLEQVKMLCANCHRMIHKRRPALSFQELKEYLKS